MTENNTGQNSKILCEKKNIEKSSKNFKKMKIGLNSGRFTKVGCVFPMVAVSILPQAEFGQKDHQEDASHFIEGDFQDQNLTFFCHIRI